MWGRPASPRPAGMGSPPRGRRLSDNGSDPLLESVDSWLVLLGCFVDLWMDIEAFRCFQLNQDPTLDFEPLECVTLPLVRSRDCVFGGARPAGLGEAGRPGFLPFFAHFWYTCSWNQNSSKTRGTH